MVYLFLAKKADFPATDDAVRSLLPEYCRLASIAQNSEISCSIARTERGKPYFADNPSIRFSVSHSGDVFACAFSNTEIGIDIQEYKNRPDEEERCRKIANRFFHPDEIDALDANTVSAFYNIWTAKEAYVKFTGQGIDGDFSEFCIFDLDEYLFQTEFERCSLSVCTPDFCEVEIIDLYNRREK